MTHPTLSKTATAVAYNPRWGLRALLTVVAAVLLVSSQAYPWWSLILYAPQYPQGLVATSYLTRLEGDVAEIDELNHYIGMMKLDNAAYVEKQMVPYILPLFILLAVAALLVRRPWVWWLTLPMATFPLVFLADLKFWLWRAGTTLDPKAALSSAIKPFTPTMLGPGKIAQFYTYGWVETGMWLALAAALLILVSTLLAETARPKAGG